MRIAPHFPGLIAAIVRYQQVLGEEGDVGRVRAARPRSRGGAPTAILTRITHMPVAGTLSAETAVLP
jgi:hypothetical protein